MKQTIIEDVSEILNLFNYEEITQILNKQISLDSDSMTEVDNFKPLYYKYKSIIETEDNPEEYKEEARVRFEKICNIFIDLICNKYGLTIDETWREEHTNELPGVVVALYNFFVTDLVNNIKEVCINFLQKNIKEVYSAFEDRKSKKDASTLTNKKSYPIEIAIIVSNIYDITTWIINQLSEEEFIKYLNNDYVPLRIINKMMEEGYMAGDFMSEINDIYALVHIKSEICFQILSIIKSGGIIYE